MANILILYNSTETYTQAVFEHLSSFSRYSHHTAHFAHISKTSKCNIDLSFYDALLIHYSVRLPLDQISQTWELAFACYKGFKGLFIQDEYEHTKRTWHWINRLKVDVVFTCVPERNIKKIYPNHLFENTKFVNVLTGYVPHCLKELKNDLPPSQRKKTLVYRGRSLPVHYGQLGREKQSIGQMVRSYAERHGHYVDIDWREEARIYGENWYDFLSSGRATLGTESGSNVFDWDGDLKSRIHDARIKYPNMSDCELLQHLGIVDEPDLMNQISPRLFEAIALRTVLVLYKGNYSGLLRPNEHYIPLERDGSNLSEVFDKLADGAALDEMAARAHKDVIDADIASYKHFVAAVEAQMSLELDTKVTSSTLRLQKGVTVSPKRALPPALTLRQIFEAKGSLKDRFLVLIGYLGRQTPKQFRDIVGTHVKQLLRI